MIFGIGEDCYCPPLDGYNDYSHWVAKWLSACWYNLPRDGAAYICGILNMFCWFVLSIPQWRLMYKTKSGKGLSLPMCLYWISADLFGCAGAILNREFGGILALAIFFVVNTSVGVMLWVYYEKIYPTIFGPANPEQEELLLAKQPSDAYGLTSADMMDDDNNGSLVPSTTTGQINATTRSTTRPGTNLAGVATNPAYLAIFIAIIMTIYLPTGTIAARLHANLHEVVSASLHAQPEGTILHTVLSNVNTLMELTAKLPDCIPSTEQSDLHKWVGFSLTCVSAVLNSISRFPQLFMNARRKTTRGLSVLYITLQLVATIFFFFARFLPVSLEFDTLWFLVQLPWCVSTGFGGLTLVICLWQIYYYGNGDDILGRRDLKYALTPLDHFLFFKGRRPAGYREDIDELTRLNEEYNAKQQALIAAQNAPSEGGDGSNFLETSSSNLSQGMMKSISFTNPIYGSQEIPAEEADQLLGELTQSLSFQGSSKE